MGQTFSNGNLSPFSWSSAETAEDPPSPLKCLKCGNSYEESDASDIHNSKNYNSFSCFKSSTPPVETKRNCCQSDTPATDQFVKKYSGWLLDRSEYRGSGNNEMMPTKRFYNMSANKAGNNNAANQDSKNSNYSCVKRYELPKNDSVDEINGNQIEDLESCSFDNLSNITPSSANSIERYISAVCNQGLENLNLGDDAKDKNSNNGLKSKNLKRTYKQTKGKLSGECGDCSKDTKNNKLGDAGGSKKKHTWSMKFCGSRLGKVNDGNASTSNANSTSDSESSCVCTSYKKVDYSEEQDIELPTATASTVDFPRVTHNLTLGWASERKNINKTMSSNWNNVSATSSVFSPSQQNRNGNECISCEGSHCHMDLNALAELSSIGNLPINITVARVGSSHSSHSGSGSNENNLILLSVSTQNSLDLCKESTSVYGNIQKKFEAPILPNSKCTRNIDSRLNAEDNQLEDCEERARLLRALEIAEGVEPPPGYNSPHIQVVSPGELRALLFQQQAPPPASSSAVAAPQPGRIHTQVDYIHCLVPDLRSITSCSYYWGKMDRYEAERLLDGKEEGTFLLRDSAQEEHLFSVSFRKYKRSLHARIEQFNHKFSFDSHDPGVFTSDTVTGLIEHYKDPSCVMFFEPMLTAPLSRTFTFSLQHLCRAVIVSCTSYDGINQLRLPNGIKAYLKEYHYRQRVRVKRFDESPEVPEETA